MDKLEGVQSKAAAVMKAAMITQQRLSTHVALGIPSPQPPPNDFTPNGTLGVWPSAKELVTGGGAGWRPTVGSRPGTQPQATLPLRDFERALLERASYG